MDYDEFALSWNFWPTENKIEKSIYYSGCFKIMIFQMLELCKFDQKHNQNWFIWF